ncbi:hypothetical protein N431DRAFT_461166 [Stipitochalara longipes BDJ]|nr:hypothetical protein N431DRAFT_461166 [Stipitochalara longipes BDJ]
MSDTPRSFDQLAPKSQAPQIAWHYADHVWLETLFKQRKKILGDAIGSIINNIESEIESKVTGDSDISDQDIAEYNAWRLATEQERADWSTRLLACSETITRPSQNYIPRAQEANKEVQTGTQLPTAKGRYYVTSRLPSKVPHVTLQAECHAINDCLSDNYGNSPDEYEAAYQDAPWLPDNIARWARPRRRNGRYLDDDK